MSPIRSDVRQLAGNTQKREGPDQVTDRKRELTDWLIMYSYFPSSDIFHSFSDNALIKEIIINSAIYFHLIVISHKLVFNIYDFYH